MQNYINSKFLANNLSNSSDGFFDFLMTLFARCAPAPSLQCTHVRNGYDFRALARGKLIMCIRVFIFTRLALSAVNLVDDICSVN